MSQTHSALQASWEQLRACVNAELERCLLLDPDCPERLRESMAYSLLAGGKRLRPVLVLLACEACGGDVEAALPAACAVEMVHTYSLIHDDLPAMDDDSLRRGRPTNHIQFGDATAILAGDALLTLAFEVIAGVKPPEVAALCCADLARASGACGMVGGQAADLEAEESGVRDGAHLESIHRRKTACLLACSVTLGARIAGADRQTLDALGVYGESVGLAFQIADDLLDLQGEEVKMGKGVRKDADRGKLTYPGLWGVEESRRKAEDLIQRACRGLQPLGEKRRRLEELAHFIVERDH